MAKKKFDPQDKMRQIKEETLSNEASISNYTGPIHIPASTNRPKTPMHTTVHMYKEDWIDLKTIATKKYLKNLSTGIDKKVSTLELMEEMIDFLKKKYDN